MRIPIVVHESDSRAGISTKIAATFASKIFTGFPGVLKGGEYVGQILSGELMPVGTHSNASDKHDVIASGAKQSINNVEEIATSEQS